MALNTSPIFVLTPKLASVSSGLAANTNLDGTGTLVTVATIGANGGRLDNVYLVHRGTNISTVLRFWVNSALVHEETMAINTVSQVASSVQVVWRAGLILPASAVIAVTTGSSLAAGIQVSAEYGEF